MKKVVNKEDVYVAHEETRNKNNTMGEIPNARVHPKPTPIQPYLSPSHANPN